MVFSTRSWLPDLLPPQDEETRVLRDSGMLSSFDSTANEADGPSLVSNPVSTPALRRLLDETADILESPIFHNVLTLLLDAGFSRLIDDRVRVDVYKATSPNQAPELQDQSATVGEAPRQSVKFASILAAITKEAHQIGRGSPNEYVQTFETIEDLDGLAAVIYSSNFETAHDHARNSQESSTDDGYLRDVTEDPLQELQPTMIDRAANLADTAWSGFESVWAKLTG